MTFRPLFIISMVNHLDSKLRDICMTLYGKTSNEVVGLSATYPLPFFPLRFVCYLEPDYRLEPLNNSGGHFLGAVPYYSTKKTLARNNLYSIFLLRVCICRFQTKQQSRRQKQRYQLDKVKCMAVLSTEYKSNNHINWNSCPLLFNSGKQVGYFCLIC